MNAPAARADLEALVRRFADAFNRNDLDEVMTSFAEDAVYEPLDGIPLRGPAAIRAAFVQHDFSSPEAWPLAVRLRQWPFRALYGQACEWEGVDVLHIVQGRLQRKQTYSRAKLPLARRGRS